MGDVPVLSPSQVVKLLRKHGFVEVRQKGSHKQFRHADGRERDAEGYYEKIPYRAPGERHARS